MASFMENYRKSQEVEKYTEESLEGLYNKALFGEAIHIGMMFSLSEEIAKINEELYSEASLLEKASDFISRAMKLLASIFSSIIKAVKNLYNRFFNKDTAEIKTELRTEDHDDNVTDVVEPDDVKEAVAGLINILPETEEAVKDMNVKDVKKMNDLGAIILDFSDKLLGHVIADDSNKDEKVENKEEKAETVALTEKEKIPFQKIQIKMEEFRQIAKQYLPVIYKSKSTELTIRPDDVAEVKEAKKKIQSAIKSNMDIKTILDDRNHIFNKKLEKIQNRKKETPAETKLLDIAIIITKSKERVAGAFKVTTDIYNKAKGALANLTRKKPVELESIFKEYASKREVYISDIVNELYSKKIDVLEGIVKDNAQSGNCDPTNISLLLVDILSDKGNEAMDWYEKNFINRLEYLKDMKEVFFKLKSNIDIGGVKDSDESGNTNKAKAIISGIEKIEVKTTLDKLLGFEEDSRFKRYFDNPSVIFNLKKNAGMVKSGSVKLNNLTMAGDDFTKFMKAVAYSDSGNHNEYIQTLFQHVIEQAEKSMKLTSELAGMTSGLKGTLQKISNSSVDKEVKATFEKAFREISQLTLSCVSIPRITYDTAMQIMGSSSTAVMVTIGARYSVQAMFEEYMSGHKFKTKEIKH